MRLIERGSPSAPIWLIGEAPGKDEDERGVPFVGASGIELDKLLREAGIDPSDCFFTNVCHIRPPSYLRNGKWVHNDIEQFFLTKSAAKKAGISESFGRYPAQPIAEGLSHLRDLLSSHSPRLLVALGNTPLWALTGHHGITKWRGSVFAIDDERDFGLARPIGGPKVICTFHPADVLRQWTHRPVVLADLRRAAREARSSIVALAELRPSWNFTIPSSVSEVRDWLGFARTTGAPLVCDTEGWGRVDCIGFAYSPHDAICIPFKHETGVSDDLHDLHYWSEEDECRVFEAVYETLTGGPITFHNAMWDMQVIGRRWGFMPRLGDDTQAMQHTAFPGLIGGSIDPVTGAPKKGGSSLSLSFCASMYCNYYRFWKDDGRHFDPEVGDERTYWYYNCEDCVRTFEVREALRAILEHGKLVEPYEAVLRSYAFAFAMMFRGIRYNRDCKVRSKDADDSCQCAFHMRKRIISARDEAKQWLDYVTETNFNPDSNPQVKDLLYRDLALAPILDRVTKGETTKDDALDRLKRKYPLTAPLITQIQNYRTLDTVKGDVDPDWCSDDGILRFGLNPAYVETFRFSSGETAWGEGGNVQNIKRPDDE